MGVGTEELQLHICGIEPPVVSAQFHSDDLGPNGKRCRGTKPRSQPDKRRPGLRVGNREMQRDWVQGEIRQAERSGDRRLHRTITVPAQRASLLLQPSENRRNILPLAHERTEVLRLLRFQRCD